MNSILNVKQISETIFKVCRSKEGMQERKSLIVENSTEEYSGNSAYKVRVENNLLSFYHNDRLILTERESDDTQSFSIGENEGVYGLGIHQTKKLNHRNSVIRMLQVNGKDTAVPFLTSTGGYAILFDNYSFMSIGVDKPCNMENAEDIETDAVIANTINVYAQDDDCFVYYVILADTIPEQIAGYRFLTGRAPLFPKWAYGFFQSREHYKTEEELLAMAREFRTRHVPIDCIVQDWNYWGDLGWNALLWDRKKYPHPEEMIRKLHEDYGMKLMISVWPSFGPETEITKKLEAVNGILAKPGKTGENWGRVHDALNPKANELIWEQMKKELFDIGVDGWWLDSTEPSFDTDSSLNLLECNPCYLGENKNYLNTCAFATSQNVYRRQRACDEKKRVFILTRSGFAGQQRNATLTWTGDIEATWEVFKTQLISLLGASASGVPYSTTDIGAFFVNYPDGNQNPEYRELYTRWFWFGAFSPIFRSHGTSTPREMWFFGEPGTAYFDSQMKASNLRYSLMPYIYAQAFKIYKDHDTIMRPLAMDFADDPSCKDIEDSYLFGDALLVSMVTDYKVREKEVYLPAGTAWYDWFTGEKYDGGQTVQANADIDRIPIFVRGGSIVLTGKPAESTALLDETELNVNIYTGKDCETFQYLDEGDNYSYEEGNYALIPVRWEDEKQVVSVLAPKGKAGNFDCNRKLHFYVNGKFVKSAEYCGEESSWKLNF